MTVRQAIQELKTEGLVTSEHGRGVFVRAAAPVVRRLASERFARQHRKVWSGRTEYRRQVADRLRPLFRHALLEGGLDPA
jgi:DNA-binding GntR family transcriptional regulator